MYLYKVPVILFDNEVICEMRVEERKILEVIERNNLLY